MDEQELDLRGFLGVIRRRRKFVFLGTFAALILSLALLLVLTPRYTATSKVLLDLLPPDLLETSASPPSNGLLNAMLDSEVELIGAEPLLKAVFDELNLLASDEFSPSQRFSEWFVHALNSGSFMMSNEAMLQLRAFERFQHRVEIEREAQTFVISIRVQSEMPSRAAEIANAIAEKHISLKQKQRILEAENVQTRFGKRINAARVAIEKVEHKLQTFFLRNAKRITSQAGDEELALLQSRLDELQTENQRRDDLLSQLTHVIQTSDWQNLQFAQMGEPMKAELATLLSSLGSGSSLPKGEEGLRFLLQEEIASLQQLKRNGQQTFKILEKELRERVLTQELPAPVLAELYEVRTEAQVARDQYEALVTQAAAGRAKSELRSANVRVISPARAPTQKSYPDMRLVGLAVLLGLGTSVVLAVVVDQHYGGVTSEGQLEAVLLCPVVASVPSYQSPNGRAGRVSVHTAVDLDPASGFSEALRRIRSEIDLSLSNTRAGPGQSNGTILLVSSAIAGEGKSTVAVALAKTLANARAKTLIVDADFRQPSVHKYLERDAKSGLIEFLNDTSETLGLSNSLERDIVPNLDALLGEPDLGVPPETLMSGRGFAELFGPLRKRYTYIIVDGPPILPVVDANYLLRHVDGLVLVTGFGQAGPSDVRKAKRIVDKYLRKDAPIFSVLNRAEWRGSYNSNY